MNDEVQALLVQLADPQFSARKIAAKKLLKIGLEAAPALRAALGSPNPIVVVRAAELLGDLSDLDAVPALQVLLDDAPSADIGSAAHAALGKLAGHERSLEARERALREYRAVRTARAMPQVVVPTEASNEPQLRRRTGVPLPSDVEGLIGLLRHPEYARRVASSEALVAIGSEVTLPLCDLLPGASYVLRKRIVEVLSRLSDPRALPALTRELSRVIEGPEEFEFQEAIVGALSRLLPHIRARPEPTHLPGILNLLRVGGQVRGSADMPMTLAGAALYLTTLAKSHPEPLLRAALPYLKGIRPFVPKEFGPARAAIEEATKVWKDLPLPADAPTLSAENLPRPSEEKL